jgi:hypothetical protein
MNTKTQTKPKGSGAPEAPRWHDPENGFESRKAMHLSRLPEYLPQGIRQAPSPSLHSASLSGGALTAMQ